MPVSELDNDATQQPDPKGGDAERRKWPRVSAERLAQVSARLSTGADVRLVDLSRGGARLETDRRMLPNSTIALKLLASDAQFVVTGRVVPYVWPLCASKQTEAIQRLGPVRV